MSRGEWWWRRVANDNTSPSTLYVPSETTAYQHNPVTMANTIDMEKQPLLEQQEEPEQELTLTQLQANVRTAQRAYFKAWSKSTSGKWNKRIMIATTTFLTL